MEDLLIRPMRTADIPQVAALEREAFAAEGVVTPFARELENKIGRASCRERV